MAQLICHHLSVGYDSKAVLTDLNFEVNEQDYRRKRCRQEHTYEDNSWIAKARGRPDYGGRWAGAK